MKYACVKDLSGNKYDYAREVFIPQNGFTIQQSFVPEVAALFVECPDFVEVGYLYDQASNTWTKAPIESQVTETASVGAGGGKQRPPEES